MEPCLTLDAIDLSAAMAAGKISAEDLMRATLAQIHTVNPAVTAIVSLRDDAALMAEARAADAAPRKGWLHGVPVAIKDLSDVAGLPTSKGSPLFAGAMAPADGLVAARLRAAGAIFIGKTNSPEFGLGSHSYNPVFGTTRNPYDHGRAAGGSSGGAAAALALRMVCVADGSDMMGSLRNPAAWNNIYGFRPTPGVIPAALTGESYFHHLATSGPMARSPADIGALLQTLAGPHRDVPDLTPAPDLAALRPDRRRLRIGWLGDWGGALPMDAGLLTSLEMALPAADWDIVPIAPPFAIDRLWQAWITLRSWDVAASLAPLAARPEARGKIKPEALWELELGQSLSGADVQAASEIRSDWFRAAARLFDSVDFLAMPATQVWPFDAAWPWPRAIAGTQMDTYHRWMQVVVPVSLIGLPSLAMPAGFGGPGGNLPFGFQIIGRHGADRAVIEAGMAWHAATRWPARRPPSQAA